MVRSKPFEKITVGALVVGLSALCFRLCNTDLSVWDLPGHLQSMKLYRDFLWPWFSGWSINGFTGYPAGTFYPPFFEWLAGGLSIVFPLLVVVKFLTVLSIFALPAFMYIFLRELGWPKINSGCAVLCAHLVLLAPEALRSSLGGTFSGLLRGGLITAQLSFPFVFLYLWLLLRGRHHKTSLHLASVSLALVILGHGFNGIAALLFSFIIFFKDFNNAKTSRMNYFEHLGWTLALSVAWWGPFLFFREFQGGDYLVNNEFDSYLIGIPWFYLPFAGLGAVALVNAIKQKRPNTKSYSKMILRLLVLTTIFYVVSKEFSETIHLIVGQTPVHPYRFLIFVYVFLAFLIGDFLASFNNAHVALGVLAAVFLAGAIVQSSRLIRHVSRHAELARAVNPSSGRGLLIMSRNGPLAESRSIHQLTYDGLDQGYRLLNGLFVESSAVSPFIQGFAAETTRDPYIWGAPNAPRAQRFAEFHASLLGIGWILTETDNPLNSSVKPETEAHSSKIDFWTDGQKKDLGMNLYTLKNDEVEFFQHPPLILKDRSKWQDSLTHWWTSESVTNSVPVLAGRPTDLFFLPGPRDHVDLIGFKRGEIDINAVSDLNRWILVKFPYFPDWRAFDDSGIETPIYRAGPNFMAVYSRGPVHFRYSRSILEIVCQIASLVTLLILIVVAFLTATKGPYKRSSRPT